MKSVILFLTILSISFAAKRTFSVRIKGRFECHGQPYEHLPLDIMHHNTPMNYNDYYRRFTDKLGEFDLSAWIDTDDYMISPYIHIWHRCWQRKDVEHNCQRKIIWMINSTSITSGPIPDRTKIFDIDSVDLRFQHPKEVPTKCGSTK